MTILQITQDTVVVKLSGSNFGSTQIVVSISVAVITAIITSLVTIWYKREELRISSAALSTEIEHNSDKLKAELIKIKDLRKNLELEKKKFHHHHLEKILELKSDPNNEKFNMIKETIDLLNQCLSTPPEYIEDHYEYEEWAVIQVYSQIDNLSNGLKGILDKFPTTFLHIHPKFKILISIAKSIKSESSQIEFQDANYDDIIAHFHERLFSLYEKCHELVPSMQEEFEEWDKIRRDFIRAKFND
jgi:hypothetical protein